MSSLVPFSVIVPKSFNLPSQPPSISPPLPAATSAAAPPAVAEAQAVSRAARPSVPPGFMARPSRAPQVPPGFGPLRPNTNPAVHTNNGPFLPANAAVGPSVSAQAYQTASQAMFGQLRVLRDGLEMMQNEVTWLKGQSKRQEGTLTWMMLGPDEYEKAKNAVANLEADVSQLINHVQGQDREIANLKDRAENVSDDNRELKREVRGLKEELGRLRRIAKKIGVGASIVGGVVLIGGACAWVRNN